MGAAEGVFSAIEAAAQVAKALGAMIWSDKGAIESVVDAAIALKNAGRSIAEAAPELLKNGAGFDRAAVALKSVGGSPAEIAAALRNGGGSYADIAGALTAAKSTPEEIAAALKGAGANEADVKAAVDAAAAKSAAEATPKPEAAPPETPKPANDTGVPGEAKGADAAAEAVLPKNILKKIRARKPLTPDEALSLNPEQEAAANAMKARVENLAGPLDTRAGFIKHPLRTLIVGGLIATPVALIAAGGSKLVENPKLVPQGIAAVTAAEEVKLGIDAAKAGDKEAAKQHFIKAAESGFDAAAVDGWLNSTISGALSYVFGQTLANWITTLFIMPILKSFGPDIKEWVAKFTGFDVSSIAGATGGPGQTISPEATLAAKPLQPITHAQVTGMSIDVSAWQEVLRSHQTFKTADGQTVQLAAIAPNEQGRPGAMATFGATTTLATKQLLSALHFYNVPPGKLDSTPDAYMVQAMKAFDNGNPANKGLAGATMLATLSAAAGLTTAGAPVVPVSTQPPGQGSSARVTEAELVQYLLKAPITGQLDDVTTTRAIGRFQKSHNLEVTGTLDEKTKAALNADLTKLEQKYKAEGKTTDEQVAAALVAAVTAKKTADAARGAAPSHGTVTPVADTTPHGPDHTPAAGGPADPQKKTPAGSLTTEPEPTVLSRLNSMARGFNDAVIKTLTLGYLDRDSVGGAVDSLVAGDIDWRTGEVLHIKENTEKERLDAQQAAKDVGSAYNYSEGAGYVGGALVGGVDSLAIGAVRGAEILGSSLLTRVLAGFAMFGTGKAVASEVKAGNEVQSPLATPSVPPSSGTDRGTTRPNQ